MTTIQIQKHNQKMLQEYGDGSFNDIVCKLIQEAGDYMLDTNPMTSVPTTMRLKDDTLKLLDSYKVTPSESYESVIVRLCLVAKDLNIK